MQFNIHEAKTQFSKLIAAVERGERVTICRNGKPVVECIPTRSVKPFPFGGWKALTKDQEGYDHMIEPTDDDLLDDMGL